MFRCSLWIFSKPYKCVSWPDPVGRTGSAICFVRILWTADFKSLLSVCSSRWCLGGLPLAPSNLNFDVSFMDASDSKRRYSYLSMMTTPDPLSGFVMTISSCRFGWWMAWKSNFGGRGWPVFRWMQLSATGCRIAAESSFRLLDRLGFNLHLPFRSWPSRPLWILEFFEELLEKYVACATSPAICYPYHDFQP